MGRVFSRDIKSKVEDREIRRVMGTGMDTMDIDGIYPWIYSMDITMENH